MTIIDTQPLLSLFSMCGAGSGQGRIGSCVASMQGDLLLLHRGEKQRLVGTLIAHTEKPGVVGKRTYQSGERLGGTLKKK